MLASKLKQANQEIEDLKEKNKFDYKKLQSKLEECEKQNQKLKLLNLNTNKKLVQAIEAMKMSVFSFELNKEDTEKMISNLSHENRNLRL